MKKSTVQDIADNTGFSTATVSRVLNHKGSFSPKTAEIILKAAEQLNYVDGQNTPPQKKMISIVVPTLADSFYSQLFDGIHEAAIKSGYAVVIVQTKSDAGYAANFQDLLSSGLIEGVIITETKDRIRQICTHIPKNMPVVQCCEYDDTLPYPYVSINDYSAAFNAVRYLFNTGRKKIGLINGSVETLYGFERERGYKAALDACELPFFSEFKCNLSRLDFYLAQSAAVKMLSGEAKPDALFCMSDTCAAATLCAAKSLHISVPDELAVIGFDNVDLAIMVDPPLTTVNQPKFDLGYMSCDSLIWMIKNSSIIMGSTLLNTDLIIRGSA